MPIDTENLRYLGERGHYAAGADLVDAADEIEWLRELAYAPDGKEYRSMVFEEAAKRGAANDENGLLRAALTEAETVLMMVEPRNHKADYLAALATVRTALHPEQTSPDP